MYEETEKQMREYFQKWEWIVSSYGWKFDVLYYANADDMPRRVDEAAAAEVFADWTRLHAVIYVNLSIISTVPEQIEYIVVHELTHMLLDPVTETAEPYALEHTTTTISRIILGLGQ